MTLLLLTTALAVPPVPTWTDTPQGPAEKAPEVPVETGTNEVARPIIGVRQWEPNSGDDCVGHGNDVFIDLGVVPAGVDIIKAVAWFYDPYHDSSTWEWLYPSYHNTIDRALEYQSNGQWITQRVDQGGNDNKRRVATESISGGSEYRLRLTGSHVEISQPCGAGAARVYWAYYFEDLAHDSGSPLMNFIRPE